MAWIKVDDRLFSSEVAAGPPLAVVLYLESLTYMMKMNYDTFPEVIVTGFHYGFRGEAQVRAAVAHLEGVGAWERQENGSWKVNHVWVEEACYIEPQGAWGTSDILSIIRREPDRACRQCGATDELQIDHIVPRSRGGETKPANLQVLCRRCNVQKRSTVPWGCFESGVPDPMGF